MFRPFVAVTSVVLTIMWTIISLMRWANFKPPGSSFSDEARVASGVFGYLILMQWAAVSIVLLLIGVIAAIFAAAREVGISLAHPEDERRLPIKAGIYSATDVPASAHTVADAPSSGNWDPRPLPGALRPKPSSQEWYSDDNKREQ